MGQWSKLPTNLLDTVEELLVLYIDKVRIRAVCSSWNSHLPKMPNHKLRRFPWLLQPFENKTDPSHGLFDQYDQKFYMLDVPELQGKLCKGSSYGWLVTVEDEPSKKGGDILPVTSSTSPADMYIINPLTRCKIQLPPRYTFPDVINYDANRVGNEYGLWPMELMSESDVEYHSSNSVNITLTDKVILSSANPLSDDCIAVAIFGGLQEPGWCKCNGDNEWKFVRTGGRDAVKDIIFYNDKLHALTVWGELLVFKELSQGKKGKRIVKLPRPYVQTTPMYLVESTDGLLMMVVRGVNAGEISTKALYTNCFEVFKLDPTNSGWVYVEDIGDNIFFLGQNSSFSISCHDFPGFKGNCIYFTDTSIAFQIGRSSFYKNVCADIGVFNLEDGSVELLPGLSYYPEMRWPPPVWVMPPSFCN